MLRLFPAFAVEEKATQSKDVVVVVLVVEGTVSAVGYIITRLVISLWTNNSVSFRNDAETVWL